MVSGRTRSYIKTATAAVAAVRGLRKRKSAPVMMKRRAQYVELEQPPKRVTRVVEKQL